MAIACHERFRLYLFALVALVARSYGARLLVDAGRPDGDRRPRLDAQGDDTVADLMHELLLGPGEAGGHAERPPCTNGNDMAGKTVGELSVSSAARKVKWGVGVSERLQKAPPSRATPGTYVGQEYRANPDLARDVTAHRMARLFTKPPGWAALTSNTSPLPEDALEPMVFHCTPISAKKFANTVADHVRDFADTGIDIVADRIGELHEACPARCQCMSGVLDDNNETMEATCTKDAGKKFRALRRRNFVRLQMLFAGCEARCLCLGAIRDALRQRHGLEELPRRFASTVELGGASAAKLAMADLDAWAAHENASVAQFTSVVAQELGPSTVRATDIVAQWAKSRKASLTLATIRGLCKAMVFEEVHQAFYECNSVEQDVPCILEAWPRPVHHKCSQVMRSLVAHGLARIFNTDTAAMRGAVAKYCDRGQEER